MMRDLATQAEALRPQLVTLIGTHAEGDPGLLERLFGSSDALDTAEQLYREALTAPDADAAIGGTSGNTGLKSGVSHEASTVIDLLGDLSIGDETQVCEPKER